MTEIYLIRHGEAEGNVFRRLHGQYESLLTPRGHQQVKTVEKRFENIHIDACYASDMTRTSLTARSIYIPKGLPLYRDPRFREVSVGIWEDIPFGWLDRFAPEEMRNFNHDPAAWRAEGAETFDVYTQRFYEGLVEAARNHDGGTIAIFTHGCVIRGLLMRQFFWKQNVKLPYCDNTGVCKLIYDKGQLSYEFVNDNSHLPDDLSTFALQKWWRATDNREEINCYFLPYTDRMVLPAGMKLPDRDSCGVCLAAILHDSPVGVVSMGKPEGETGRIIGMALRDGLDGRMYGDQLLGAAFSHFRKLGCKHLAANPGWYPDDILTRYGFTGPDLRRSIDVNAFDWGNGHAQK